MYGIYRKINYASESNEIRFVPGACTMVDLRAICDLRVVNFAITRLAVNLYAIDHLATSDSNRARATTYSNNDLGNNSFVSFLELRTSNFVIFKKITEQC